jgi:hypothetical protein
MRNLASKKIFWLILSLLFTLPTILSLLKPGYFNMHDDLQMMRLLQMEKCLKDGQIPCRWVPDMGYGYGYPLFNFYPPLPFYFGQIFRFFGISFVWSAKLIFVSQHLFSALAMFAFASALFSPFSAFLATVFYSYAPYHALDTYVRGALNESFAFIFFPLLFLYTYRIIKEKKKLKPVLFLALSFALLILSHSIMVMIITPFLAFWVLYLLLIEKKLFLSNHEKINLPQTGRLKSFFFSFFGWTKNLNFPLFLKFIYSGLMAISLSAFFFLPLIFETKYVQLESMFKGYYSYIVHFTSLNQLFFSRFWGFGASVWGQEDQMSFQVGHLHWILALFLLLYSLIRFISKKRLSRPEINTIFFTFLAFLAAFLTHERSGFIWKLIPPLQKAQFSWRFLTVSTFFFSLPVALLPDLIKKQRPPIKNLIYAVTLSVLLILNLSYFKPGASGPITDQEKFSGRAWMYQQTSGIYDYLPRWASIAAQGEAGDLIDQIEGQVDIQNKQKGTDWFSFQATVKDSEAKLTLAQHYFPDFKIYDGLEKLHFDIEPELGRMVLRLPPGDYQINVRLEDTPIRKFANLLSLLAVFLFIYLVRKTYARKRKTT